MRRWFQNKTLSTQLVIIIVVSLVCLFSALNAFTYQAAKNYEASQQDYLRDFTSQLEKTVQSNYNSLSQIARLAAYNEDVQNYLLAADPQDRYVLYINLTRNLMDISTLNSQILDIVIVNNENQRINLSDTAYSLPQIDCPDSLLHLSPLQKRGGHGAYLVARKIISSIDSYNQTSQQIGSVYLVLTTTAFTSGEEFGALTGDSDIFLVDAAGNTLWQNTSGGETAHEEKDEATVDKAIPFTNFRVLAYRTSQFSYIFQIYSEQWLVLILLLTLAGILLGIWFLFAHNTVRPYEELIRFFGESKQDGLDSLRRSITLTGSRESQLVGNAVNNMLQEIHDLTEELITSNFRLYESELLARQAELMHLRSEINPHFLYNTLETMVGIAYSENQPELARIARSLSLIFKYSIKGKDRVPLRDEVKVAQNYLLIQQYRFKGRFEVEYALPESCLERTIPKMVLQPLIENAIVHGVEHQEKLCHILLYAQEEAEVLTLTVTDDGGGIPQDVLAALRSDLDASLSAEDVARSRHIGLRNVNDRIRLMYGQEYGVILSSTLGQGTTVLLRIPIQEQGGQEDVSSDDRR